MRPGEAGAESSGFGGVTVGAGRSLEFEWLPFDLSIQGQVKLPTGARRLSTGKVDASLDLELSKSFGPVAPFVSADYRVYGDSADLELENGWAVSAGATLTYLGITFIGSYDWSQSPFELAPAKEIFAVASGALRQNWNWTLYGSKGLNAGAADKLFGLALTHRLGRRKLSAPF